MAAATALVLYPNITLTRSIIVHKPYFLAANQIYSYHSFAANTKKYSCLTAWVKKFGSAAAWVSANQWFRFPKFCAYCQSKTGLHILHLQSWTRASISQDYWGNIKKTEGLGYCVPQKLKLFSETTHICIKINKQQLLLLLDKIKLKYWGDITMDITPL